MSTDESLPFLSCLCPTFRRPELLADSVACFEALDYPLDKRELLILDDAGQYPDQPAGPSWQIISIDRRFATLGEKRNTLAALARRDAEALVIWDDDDVYLPWTLRAHAWALQHAPVSHPQFIFCENDDGSLGIKNTLQRGFQASQAIRRELYRRVGGYPAGNSAVDQQLTGLLRRESSFADPTQQWPLAYVYRWSRTNQPHLSAFDSKIGYDEIQNRSSELVPVADFRPRMERNWAAQALETLGLPHTGPTGDLPQHWSRRRTEIVSGSYSHWG